MANKEQLDLLRQGREVWNEWRKQQSATEPDLSFANLSETDLSGTDLNKVNLMGANLSGVDLSYANLSYANLSKPYQEDRSIREIEKRIKSISYDFLNFRGANLSRANLSHTDLTLTNLRGAILEEANLSYSRMFGAHLRYAFLRGANLRGADLNTADLMAADLFEADLFEADLFEANLRYADLEGANLKGVDCKLAAFGNANLSRANLEKTTIAAFELSETNLSNAILRDAKLKNVNLKGANFTEADLSGADLSGADLSGAIFIRTNLKDAILNDCRIFGISAWDLELEGAKQNSLIITKRNQPNITVDNLKIAQFIYLLLNNEEIRDVINTLTTKAVLILGRFTPERKEVLVALKEKLREHNYLPILFDFNPVNTQTVRETVRTLAHLSHFIIADLTDPSSIPEELETIIPTLAVPVQPLLDITQKREFSMFKGYGIYPWVLPIYRYNDLTSLLSNLQEKVIEPATQKVRELAEIKVQLNQ